jgi:U6 snRNA-associated Sm-like protein LSm7
MDYTPYLDKEVNVSFVGGREIVGILKGFDQVSNLVMDKVVEILKDKSDNAKEIGRRYLGLLVVRGPNVRIDKFYN